jgi:predicted permease
LNELLRIFLDNLLPIFLIAGSGYLLSRFMKVDPRPFSQITFYLFSPFLVFNLLTAGDFSGLEILRTMGFALILIILVGAITWFAGRLFKVERKTLIGMMLTTMCINAGNYGLPVVLFAFGESGLRAATPFFVMNAIFIYTAGVVIASSGSARLSSAFVNLLKVPTIYALLLAFVFIYTGWEVPSPLARSAKLLGDASIPSLLVLLGMQLHNSNWSTKVLPMGIVSVIRLVVSPVLALVLVPFFGIAGVARQSVIVESAMPSAILSTLLATEYDVEPSFVTAVVFLTTIISPITLTILLKFLGA